jgi:dipeptidyl aminopeptidase/acylaminoacyl peptidase
VKLSLPLLCCVVASAAFPGTATAQSPAKRHLRAGDIYQLRGVNDPQLSPDGNWVAYSVTAVDSAKDKSDTDVWMTSWDGRRRFASPRRRRAKAARAGVPMDAISRSSRAVRKARADRYGCSIAEAARRSG